MEHLAIMRKSWRLTQKILSGEKSIESRWYKSKRDAYNKINIDDIIYFKDSGEPVKIKCKVSRLVKFSDINQDKVMKILSIYGKEDGIKESEVKKFFKLFKDKKYCVLIFLKDVKKVKPFYINKKGFGSMTSWITLKHISSIKSCDAHS